MLPQVLFHLYFLRKFSLWAQSRIVNWFWHFVVWNLAQNPTVWNVLQWCGLSSCRVFLCCFEWPHSRFLGCRWWKVPGGEAVRPTEALWWPTPASLAPSCWEEKTAERETHKFPLFSAPLLLLLRREICRIVSENKTPDQSLFEGAWKTRIWQQRWNYRNIFIIDLSPTCLDPKREWEQSLMSEAVRLIAISFLPVTFPCHLFKKLLALVC